MSQGAVVVVLLGAPSCVGSPTTETGGDHDIVNYEFPVARAEIEAKMRAMDELDLSLESLRNLHLESPKFSKLVHDDPRMGFEEMLAQEWSGVSALEGLSIDWRDLQIDVFGDVAVATSFPHFVLRPPNGEPVELDLVGTLVWVRTDDGWKIAHENNYRVEDIVEDPFPAEQAAIATEIERLVDAFRRGDGQQLRAAHLDSPKFTKFGGAPGRQGFEDALADEVAKLGGMRDVEVEHRDPKIDVFGDVAVVTSFPHITATAPSGEYIEVDLRATGVWVKTDDGWKLVHEHNTKITAD
jgi:ketosteroid isomerase-like protein